MVQASSVARSANCLCNLFIVGQFQERTLDPITLSIDAPSKSLRIVTFGPAPFDPTVTSVRASATKPRPFHWTAYSVVLSAFRALYATSCNLRHPLPSPGTDL